MTIQKKLYLNFGLILGIMFAMFLVSMFAMYRERSAKATAAATEAVRFQMMQNRLTLGSYLLSGDTREVDKLRDGTSKLGDLLRDAENKASSSQQSDELKKLGDLERSWATDFSEKMLAKRKDVDAGNATVADLQIAYLQADPGTWLKNSNDIIAKVQDERLKSDETASFITTIVSFLGLILALGIGAMIAFRTSKSITDPLSHLMGVAREIGESGDLEHTIDINRDDEIGELGRTFAKMVAYLKEMATVSEAIARGDLTVEVEPRSKRDTLGNAFSKMLDGLRSIVRSVRDAAAQVAAGSNQVADASEESAKISLQSSSAIDEVTSTMHEMSHQRAEHGEEHADAGLQRQRDLRLHRPDGGQHPACRRYGEGSAGYLQPFARRSASPASAPCKKQRTVSHASTTPSALPPRSFPLSASVPTTSARSSRSSTIFPNRPTCLL